MLESLPHVISPSDLSQGVRDAVMREAAALKQSRELVAPSRLRVGALYFNASLRTRTSFEGAAALLGAHAQTLNVGTDTWGLELDPNAVMDGDKAENIVEAARVLGQMFHILGVRSFRGPGPWSYERTEPVLRAFAKYAGIPIVSLEGTTHHPCQGLADLLTLREQFGADLRGLPVSLCWAWHPRALPAAVPHTFLLQAALAGCDVTVAHPPGFELDPEIAAQAEQAAAIKGSTVRFTNDRAAALEGRKIVYVKSWGPLDPTSPATDPALRDAWLLDRAALAPTDNARVMHCLPVRRNVVISGDLLDSDRSLVTEQAGNRLWAQAGLLHVLSRQPGVLA